MVPSVRRPVVPLWNVTRIVMLIVATFLLHWTSVSAWTTCFTVSRTMNFHPLDSLPGRRRRCHLTIQWDSKTTNKNDQDPGSKDPYATILLEQLGILAQPIVGISLFSVATTGGGLPAGPLGLVGAVEGLSYLLVVLVALQAIRTPSHERTTSQQLSLFTIGLGVVVLFLLITTQGCIPNAKPILDYSAYVRVCDPN